MLAMRSLKQHTGFVENSSCQLPIFLFAAIYPWAGRWWSTVLEFIDWMTFRLKLGSYDTIVCLGDIVNTSQTSRAIDRQRDIRATPKNLKHLRHP